MYILALKCKGIHNFVNHDKYKGYGCTRIHEFTKETRNVVQSREIKSKGFHCVQNAIEPGSPLPIHRHQKSSETVVCLRGRLVEEFYDELERRCTEAIELSPGGPVVALNIPIGQWHTVRALESGTVIMEVKDGPYEPTGEEDILTL